MHEFRPPRWLPGPHLQTLWGVGFRSKKRVTLRRERIATPDGDTLILDHLDGPREDLRVLFLHGLEGSSYSVYIQGMLKLLEGEGVPATVLNFRSCARDPNDLKRMIPNDRPRFYHSGETTDFDWVVSVLRQRDPDRPLAAIGTSLGGNVLLKWLGEHPEQTALRRAVAISVPFDLGAGARHLERGLGPLYVSNFLRTLKPKAMAVARRFELPPERIDLEGTKRARTFYEFDEAATGPLHGFTGAVDYWTRSSSVGFIDRITTPTLCISAEDDPFLPPSVLDEVKRRASPAVEVIVTREGGHTGFVSGSPWNCRYWAERAAVRRVLGS